MMQWQWLEDWFEYAGPFGILAACMIALAAFLWFCHILAHSDAIGWIVIGVIGLVFLFGLYKAIRATWLVSRQGGTYNG